MLEFIDPFGDWHDIGNLNKNVVNNICNEETISLTSEDLVGNEDNLRLR